MRAGEKTDPLRVEMSSPMLGGAVMVLEQDDRVPSEPREQPTPPVEPAPNYLVQLPEFQIRQILGRLDSVVWELQQMRREAQDRTWAARWRRFLAWVKTTLGRG